MDKKKATRKNNEKQQKNHNNNNNHRNALAQIQSKQQTQLTRSSFFWFCFFN